MNKFTSFKSLLVGGVSLIAALAASACVIEVKTTGGCVEPSGVVVTTTGTLAPYNELDVSHSVAVKFEVGGDYSYRLTGDSAIVSAYEVKLKGEEVSVGLKNLISITKGFGITPKVELTLVVPDYDAFNTLSVDLSGDSQIDIPAFKMQSLEIDASGASHANIYGVAIASLLDIDCSGASQAHTNDIQASEINVDCSGASNTFLSGTTLKLTSDCSGASRVSATDLVVKEYAKIECSGASSTGTGDLTGVTAEFDASGVSNITYRGEPDIKSIESSGMSHISK